MSGHFLISRAPYDMVGGSGSVGGALLKSEQCNTTSFGAPAVNASLFSGFNNDFGVGTLVFGRDYWSRIWGYKATWPAHCFMEWSFPASGGTGLGSFAYAYPMIEYGGSNYNYQSPYGRPGAWPMRIDTLDTMTVTYDLTLGGNLVSYDVLIDSFVTTDANTVDGSFVAEISFYPYANGVPFFPNGSVVHQFSFGYARVGWQGTEIGIEPCDPTGSTRVSLLKATIDLKEVYQYVASLGFLGMTGKEYVRGWEFGPECQVPAAWNSAPFNGTLRFNKLSAVWTGPTSPINLILNGTFTSFAHWNFSAGGTVSGNQAVLTSYGAGNGVFQYLPTVPGRPYTLTYTLTVTSGSMTPRFESTSTGPVVNSVNRTASGTYTETITPGANDDIFNFFNPTTFTGTISNVSLVG